MSKDQMRGKSEDGITQNSEGLKRRDLLLSGTSLLAASALSGAGLATSAQAQQPAATPPTGQRPNIVVIMGDDIGMWNIGAYHRGMMAGRTPNLDKLAAEGMLFTDYYAEASCTGGPGAIHHRRAADPHRHDHGRSGRRRHRYAGAGGDDRDGTQSHGLRHRPVRQEPPRRSQRVSANRSRLRRVLRLSLSPRRDGGPRASRLPAGIVEHRRPAQHGPFAGRPTRTTRR